MTSTLRIIGSAASSTRSAVAASVEEETPLRIHRRFDRAARLLSEKGIQRIMNSRVAVFGLGGVGSFAAEGLARNAVGHLTLVDFDDICVTNTNRQLHALKGNIGLRKVDVMADRMRAIHPTGEIEAVGEFYSAENSERLLSKKIDFVVDAIDNMTAKAHLLASCKALGIPVVSSMGAAARLDPTRIRVADLADTNIDPFARSLRKIMREKHGIVCRAGEPVGITAVFSEEPPIAPEPLSYDAATGFVCVCPNKDNGVNTCDRKSRIDGSAAFVTGAFGLACASVVVRALSGK